MCHQHHYAVKGMDWVDLVSVAAAVLVEVESVEPAAAAVAQVWVRAVVHQGT